MHSRINCNDVPVHLPLENEGTDPRHLVTRPHACHMLHKFVRLSLKVSLQKVEGDVSYLLLESTPQEFWLAVPALDSQQVDITCMLID